MRLMIWLVISLVISGCVYRILTGIVLDFGLRWNRRKRLMSGNQFSLSLIGQPLGKRGQLLQTGARSTQVRFRIPTYYDTLLPKMYILKSLKHKSLSPTV